VLNTPLSHSLEILDKNGSIVWTADLEEDGDPLDEDAAKARTAVPVFHGLSKGGNVTGEVFYANYGRQEDYDAVQLSGVNITGKIALVRYGGIFRGLKVSAMYNTFYMHISNSPIRSRAPKSEVPSEHSSTRIRATTAA
jgi:N-acetylated-alpha-linked acidic dipeptidase